MAVSATRILHDPQMTICEVSVSMKASLLSSLLLLAGTSVFAASTPTMNGKWKVHNNVAGYESDQVCTFMQNKTVLTGTCTSDEKPLTITGTVQGNQVTWKYNSEWNGTPLTVTHVATLDGAGKFSGTIEVDPFDASGDFTATPVEPGAAASKPNQTSTPQ